MSSGTYSSYLKPDPWLRLIVDVSARLLIAGAIVVALTLSLGVLPRLGLSMTCLVVGWIEIARLYRGQRACRAICLASDGSARILGSDQDWASASLESGSFVLHGLAWLRFKTADGVLVTELLRGDTRHCHDWRRLQVIWRHIG